MLSGDSQEYRNNSSSWTHAFQTTAIQQLRALYLDNINCSMESIITLLNTCCNTIQELQLDRSGETQVLDKRILQRLQTLPQLGTLSLRRVKFADESSVLTLLSRLPTLENLIFKDWAPFILPEQAAPFLINLKHLTYEDTRQFFMSFSMLMDPGVPVFLSQPGSKLETFSMTNLGFNVPFRDLLALAALPSLKSLCVNIIAHSNHYINQEPNEEEKEQHLLEFFKAFLREGDNHNMRRSITTASTATIKHLIFDRVYKMTYARLSVLGDLTNLQSIDITFFGTHHLDNTKSLATADNACLSLDLCGVLELLRKGRKLRMAVFCLVISSGNHIPYDYLKTKLVEQKQSNFQLRKYVVKCINRDPLSTKMLFHNSMYIINTHYK